MNTSADSIRRIVRTSSITGLASIITVCLGLVRTKVAAMLLGPTGVGMIGLLQNLMSVAANVSSLGFRTSGTRDIAEASAKQDHAALAVARCALFWGTAVLALAGGSAMWFGQAIIAEHLAHDKIAAGDIGLLGLGVVLAVASGSQTALLSGLRRIGDLARIGIISSALATVVGAAVLALLGQRGVLLFILIAPASTFLMGLWYARLVAPVRAPSTPWREVALKWGRFALLGLAFMLSGVAESMGELAVRSLVIQEDGLVGAGHFQAAWTISAMYTGFILTSMGADFYPRLSASVREHATANRLVNEQTLVALLLAGPLLILMVGCAPWVIRILYSESFHEATAVLRWQLLGDVLKVVSWPLGYLILASGDGKRYLLSAVMMVIAFVTITAYALPKVGLEASGIAFVGMYLVYFPTAYWMCRMQTGFSWNAHVLRLFVACVLGTGGVFAVAMVSETAALVLSGIVASAFGAFSFRRLRVLSAPRDAANPALRAA